MLPSTSLKVRNNACFSELTSPMSGRSYPKHSMYGIFTYIWHMVNVGQHIGNVGQYTRNGVSGYSILRVFCPKVIPKNGLTTITNNTLDEQSIIQNPCDL